MVHFICLILLKHTILCVPAFRQKFQKKNNIGRDAFEGVLMDI